MKGDGLLKASDVVREAERYEGYRETGTNLTEFNREFGKIVPYPHKGYGYPWCQSFQSVIVKRAYARLGVPEPREHAADLIPWTASCATAVAWFKRRGQFDRTPKVGSQVFFGPSGSTHVELVIAVGADWIKTIGGNTAGRLNGVYQNGNGVYKKTINRRDPKIYGYGHPRYSAEVNPVTGPLHEAPRWPGKYLRMGSKSRFLRKWQQQAARHGWTVATDGIFGPQTLGVVQSVQKRARLPVDGVIGPKTWAAVWSPLT